MNPFRPRSARAVLARGATLLCLTLTSMAAQAQAWLPEKGSLSFSLNHSEALNKKHYTSTGDEIDVGHTDLTVESFAGSYSPSDRVQVRAVLPYVTTRYRGPGLGGHDTEIDNGSWHSAVTDLQLSVHFQVTDGPIAFAPYVGVIIPIQDYVVQGHAAPGRGLNEYWVGMYVGGSFNEWIPRMYVQGRYNYAFVDEVAGIAHDRNNADLEIGYFLNSNWSIRVLAAWQDTLGGIDVPVPVTGALFPYHDRLASESYVKIGGGTAWAINDRWSAYAFYMEAVEGKNGHKTDHSMAVGVSYGFGGPLHRRRQ